MQVLQHNSHTVVEAVRPGPGASEGFRMEGVGSALHVRYIFYSQFLSVKLYYVWVGSALHVR